MSNEHVLTSTPSHNPRLGVGGLWDGISGTLLRQMTYSMTRFSAYEKAKKSIAPGEKNPSALKLAICGSIGVYWIVQFLAGSNSDRPPFRFFSRDRGGDSRQPCRHHLGADAS